SSIPGALALEHFWISLLHSAAITGVFFLLLVRVGLVASVAAFYTWGLFVLFPVTMQMSAWYAGSGVTALLVPRRACLVRFLHVARRPACAGRDRASRVTLSAAEHCFEQALIDLSNLDKVSREG